MATRPVRIEMTAATVQGRTRRDRERAGKLPGVQKDITRKTKNVGRVARATCPVRTGKAKASIRTDKVVENGLPAGRVSFGGPGVSYADIIVRGSRPHVIRARRAKALRFEQGGQIRFATSVNHPGTKPNPFLVRALRAAAY